MVRTLKRWLSLALTAALWSSPVAATLVLGGRSVVRPAASMEPPRFLSPRCPRLSVGPGHCGDCPGFLLTQPLNHAAGEAGTTLIALRADSARPGMVPGQSAVVQAAADLRECLPASAGAQVGDGGMLVAVEAATVISYGVESVFPGSPGSLEACLWGRVLRPAEDGTIRCSAGRSAEDLWTAPVGDSLGMADGRCLSGPRQDPVRRAPYSGNERGGRYAGKDTLFPDD